MAASFHGVIAFALMALMLVVGAALRKRLGWLQRGLVPASIIGGLIGLVLLSIGAFPGYGPGDFTTLTFHFFTLSFMSLCLTGAAHARQRQGSVVVGGLWLTLIWTVSLGVQGVLGYGMVVAYNQVAGMSVSPMLGAMVTHGFTQGPGQALTYGNLWERLGVENAAQVGLIYASLGFLVAFIVGVPMARWLIRRRPVDEAARAMVGGAVPSVPQGAEVSAGSVGAAVPEPDAAGRVPAGIGSAFLTGFHAYRDRPPSGYAVTHPANLDSLAWHFGLLGIAYVLTHLWLSFMGPLTADIDLGGIKLGIFFDHNLFFIHGLVVCVLMRRLLDGLGWSHLVDDGTMQTITGSAVDLMVVGTLMSIQFAVLHALLVPLTLVTLLITLATLLGSVLLIRWSGRHGGERAVTMFGCCCGSTGSGLLLLRILDPDYSTPVARELAFYNIAIVVVNFHVLYLFAPVAPSLGTMTYLLVFGGTALVALLFVPVLMRLARREMAQEGR